MSNEKPLLNQVIARWLKPPQGLVPQVNCVTCSMAEKDPMHASRWRDFKCCTFQPFLANFLCGALLEAGQSPFVNSPNFTVQALGLVPAAAFRQSCEATMDERRGESHLCAFYKSRSCSIWALRPGECSLYYCVESSSREAWSERSFATEATVAQMALAELGFSPAEIAGQVEELNSPRADTVSLPMARAEEIYRAAWSFARKTTANDIDSWFADG